MVRARPRRRLSPWVIDGTVTVLVLAVTVLDLATRKPLAGQHVTTPLAYLLVVVMALPFVLHRRFPLPVAAVVLVAELVYALGYYSAYPGLAAFVLVFGVAAHCDRRTSSTVAAATLVVMSLAVSLQPAGVSDQSTWITTVLATAVAWLSGLNLRHRRARWAALEERTHRLEREREERARQAVVEERLRIARELHDVVAHSMSVIAVQSAVGHHVSDAQPEQARQALAAIETTSRSALAEMRRLLGVLRADDEQPGALSPTPGLADIGPLVDQVTQAGIATTVTSEGTAIPLPDLLSLSCYRVIQESLTNVIKHGGSPASVLIRYGPETVDIEVVDAGPNEPRGQHVVVPGHGLVGMRERVGLFGGRFTAGPRPGGGFRVAATFRSRGWRRDPRGGRRRPGTGPRRLPGPRRLGADLEVVAEAADGAEAVRLVARAPPGRGADGHPDAGHGRHRGHPADHLRATAAGEGPHPHDLRPRRVRLPGSEGRRERFPAEGHPTGRAAAGHPRRGCRGRAAVAERHPPPDRGVRAPARAAPRGSRPSSPVSPTASARF